MSPLEFLQRPGLRFDLGQEVLDVFLTQLIQGGFFRAPARVLEFCTSRNGPNRLAHDLFLMALLLSFFTRFEYSRTATPVW